MFIVLITAATIAFALYAILQDPIITALAVIWAYVYLLPSFIAFGRNHQDQYAIGALNLFTGWSFLGWVISIVWSLLPRTED